MKTKTKTKTKKKTQKRKTKNEKRKTIEKYNKVSEETMGQLLDQFQELEDMANIDGFDTEYSVITLTNL